MKRYFYLSRRKSEEWPEHLRGYTVESADAESYEEVEKLENFDRWFPIDTNWKAGFEIKEMTAEEKAEARAKILAEFEQAST